jgi:hypothetical protein
MKERYTKRVEWRLENASKLQKEYPPGRELLSPLFSMAGLHDLQFVVHPNSSADGFCAMFVSAPPGTVIRGFLCMGDQKRSLKHEFDKREPIGRANMCLWQQAIDADDCVVIALEVEQARTTKFEALSSTIPHGARRRASCDDEVKHDFTSRKPRGCAGNPRASGRLPTAEPWCRGPRDDELRAFSLTAGRVSRFSSEPCEQRQIDQAWRSVEAKQIETLR